MEPIANLDCALKVNVGCDFCKMKIMEVTSAIAGIYSVSIDGEEGLLKFTGEVDPHIVMRALARTGKHAELKYAKLEHPLAKRNNYYDYYNNSYNNNNSYGYDYGNNYYGRVDDPYNYRRSPMLRGYNSTSYSHPLASCVCHPSTSRLAPQYTTSYPYHGSSYYQYSQPPPLPRLPARSRAYYY